MKKLQSILLINVFTILLTLSACNNHTNKTIKPVKKEKTLAVQLSNEDEDEKKVTQIKTDYKIVRYMDSLPNDFFANCKTYEETYWRDNGIELNYQFNVKPDYELFKNNCKDADGLIVGMASKNRIGGDVRVDNIPIIEALEPISIYDKITTKIILRM